MSRRATSFFDECVCELRPEPKESEINRETYERFNQSAVRRSVYERLARMVNKDAMLSSAQEQEVKLLMEHLFGRGMFEYQKAQLFLQIAEYVNSCKA